MCVYYYTVLCLLFRNDGRLLFDTMNLNTQACWYTADKPASRDLDVLCLQQLEKNTFFVGSDRILSCFKNPLYKQATYE